MREYLRRYKKSSSIKNLISNFLSLSIIQVIGMVLPLFTFPYILRVLGFENYGIIALATSLIAYFKTLTDYSFNITATRDVSIHRNNKKALNLIFSKVIIIKAFFLIVSWSIILVILYLYKPFQEHIIIYCIMSLTLIGDILFPQWFFQGMEKMKFITIANIIVQVIYTILIFVVVQSSSDLVNYALLIALSNFLIGLIGFLFLRIKFEVRFVAMPLTKIKESIKHNFPVFINQFMPQLYNNSATFLLAFFTSNTLIGIYAATRKITDISTTVLNLVSRTFFPFLNRRKNAFNVYKKLMLTTTLIGVILLIISYPFLFWIFNINNELAIYVHVVMALSLVGYVLYDIYGLNYLIVHRQDRIVMKNTILMSLIGFIILIPFIFFGGIIGASITVLVTRLLMGSGVYYKSIKYAK